MKHTEAHFELHRFLRLRIRDTIGIADRLLMRPWRGYAHYRAAAPAWTEPPDLDVDIAPFHAAPPRDATVIERRFLVAPGYFHCDDTYKILWWRVELAGWESPHVRLRIDRNCFGTAAIGSRLIDCTVRYLLNRREAPAVHGCGVCNASGAFLLCGRSGVGKSTTAMRLLDLGFKLLGDNWVIVHGGTAWSMHFPVNVLDYNVAPEMWRRMPVADRMDLRAKAWMRKVSLGYFKKSTPVMLQERFPEAVAEQAPLRKVLTFIQGPELRIRPMARQEGLRRLAVNDRMDREAFARYMTAYACVLPLGEVAGHWERLEQSLALAIPASVPFLEVQVPRRIDTAVVECIVRAMED